MGTFIMIGNERFHHCNQTMWRILMIQWLILNRFEFHHLWTIFSVLQCRIFYILRRKQINYLFCFLLVFFVSFRFYLVNATVTNWWKSNEICRRVLFVSILDLNDEIYNWLTQSSTILYWNFEYWFQLSQSYQRFRFEFFRHCWTHLNIFENIIRRCSQMKSIEIHFDEH